MYSPKIIAERAAKVESTLPIKLREYTIAEVDEWNERLKQLIHPDSKPHVPQLVRPLNEEEQAFVSNEILMTKINFPYWALRYCWLKADKGGIVRMQFWESQELLLKTIAAIEEAKKPILIINLKARQVGSSTLSEAILTHKCTNMYGVTSVVASDEPTKSEFLFNMMERFYNHLPFYLRPHRKFQVKGQQLFFDKLDSLIQVDSGNKRVGGIGQGTTIHSGHLSELATWENTEMITADLLPALMSGASTNTFFILESTANGRSGDWYTWWKAAKRKRFHGFVPVFIPFWILKEKYASDPPTGWGPSERVLKMAESLKNLKGVDLTRNRCIGGMIPMLLTKKPISWISSLLNMPQTMMKLSS